MDWVELIKVLGQNQPLLIFFLVLILLIFGAPYGLMAFFVLQLRSAVKDFADDFKSSLKQITEELKELRETVMTLIYEK